MGKRGNRGQVAMEFLMTYGWAILIILIAVGALWMLGVFSPNVSTNCSIDAPFSCQDAFIGESGVMLRLAVGQNVNNPSLSSIKVNGETCPEVIGEIDPGRQNQILCKGIQLEEGESVSVEIDVTYKKSGGFRHSVTGSLTGESKKSSKSCSDNKGPSGAYLINPSGEREIVAYCDTETDGGGWTLVGVDVPGDSSAGRLNPGIDISGDSVVTAEMVQPSFSTSSWNLDKALIKPDLEVLVKAGKESLGDLNYNHFRFKGTLSEEEIWKRIVGNLQWCNYAEAYNYDTGTWETMTTCGNTNPHAQVSPDSLWVHWNTGSVVGGGVQDARWGRNDISPRFMDPKHNRNNVIINEGQGTIEIWIR